MGIAVGFGNISSSLPVLAASKDIGVAVLPVYDKAIAFFLAMAIALCWSWGPLAVCAVTPQNFDRIFDPIIHFLKKHGSQLIAARVLCHRLLPYHAWRGVGDDVVGHLLTERKEPALDKKMMTIHVTELIWT